MTQLAQAQPDLGDRILAAERGRASRWRIEFLAVWLVILAGMIAFILITVDLDAGFITKVVPFIVGGVGVTLLISFSSITLAIILAALGALGRLSRNPIANGIATSTSRSSAAPRSSCRSSSSTWRCRRPASRSTPSPAASSPWASTTAPT